MINETIADWAGIKTKYACTIDGYDCGDCVLDTSGMSEDDCYLAAKGDTKETCGFWKQIVEDYPDYQNDSNVTLELLSILKKKGYNLLIDIHTDATLWWLWKYGMRISKGTSDTLKSVIINAVEAAINYEKENV